MWVVEEVKGAGVFLLKGFDEENSEAMLSDPILSYPVDQGKLMLRPGETYYTTAIGEGERDCNC